MKALIFIGLISILLISCNKEPNSSDIQSEIESVAEVVDFDLNCSTCILYFPEEYEIIKTHFGDSQYNYYQAVNLDNAQFAIGQLIKVKVRSAESDELTCKTQYPSNDYVGIWISEYEELEYSQITDTFEINVGECYNDFNNISVCFNKVTNDSRCPINAYCVWEGNAEIELEVTLQGGTKYEVALNTNLNFQTDTNIGYINISLLELSPYPVAGSVILPTDYKAKLVLTERTIIK